MDKRELILQEAEKLFSQKGYYGLGLTELLMACGIPKGSFYYYFPDGKIQLIQETLLRAYLHMAEGIRHCLSLKSTALAAFEGMLDFFASGIDGQRHFASHFVAMIAIESVYLDPRVHEICKKIYGDWQRLYQAELLRFGYAQEESVQKAQALFALVHGSMLSSWVLQDGNNLLLAKQALPALLEKRER